MAIRVVVVSHLCHVVPLMGGSKIFYGFERHFSKKTIVYYVDFLEGERGMVRSADPYQKIGDFPPHL